MAIPLILVSLPGIFLPCVGPNSVRPTVLPAERENLSTLLLGGEGGRGTRSDEGSFHELSRAKGPKGKTYQAVCRAERCSDRRSPRGEGEPFHPFSRGEKVAEVRGRMRGLFMGFRALLLRRILGAAGKLDEPES